MPIAPDTPLRSVPLTGHLEGVTIGQLDPFDGQFVGCERPRFIRRDHRAAAEALDCHQPADDDTHLRHPTAGDAQCDGDPDGKSFGDG